MRAHAYDSRSFYATLRYTKVLLHCSPARMHSNPDSPIEVPLRLRNCNE